MSQETNVLGEPLQVCGCEPKTGFFRDGMCRVGTQDLGNHSVCAIVTEEFLEYSASQGNDLMTPAPELGFPGLKPGDRWCLCATRWKQAYEAGCAPPVILNSTSSAALASVSLEQLTECALH